MKLTKTGNLYSITELTIHELAIISKSLADVPANRQAWRISDTLDEHLIAIRNAEKGNQAKPS